MLEIFGVGYWIKLILITTGNVCVIVGIDWWSQFGALIDCEGQLLIVRDPSGGVFVTSEILGMLVSISIWRIWEGLNESRV